MKKLVNFVIILGSALILSSCGLNNVPCFIDNPTDQEIVVTLDGKEHKIAPLDFVKIGDIPKGEHKYSLNGGSESIFNVETVSMLNPTMHTYVFVQEEYGSSNKNLVLTEIALDGIIYEGYFELKTGLVIPHDNVNYNTITPLPEEVSVSNSSSGVVQTKLFRSADFISTYK